MPIRLTLAIGFTLALTVVLPVGLMLALKRRGGKWSTFFVGAVTFMLSAMVLEQLLHYIVQTSPLGPVITGNIWLTALYGGIAAGVFEETGRFAAFRLLCRRQTRPVTALAYGAGHGGIEAFLIVGVTMANNLVIMAATARGQTPEGLETAAEMLLATPASMFLWAAFERATAIALHMANSVLVFAAATRREKRWLYPTAIGVHAVVDIVAVAANAWLPVAAVELITLAVVLLVALFAARVYKNLGKNAETT